MPRKVLFAVLYLIRIPLFAGIYYIWLPNSFYHSSVQFEYPTMNRAASGFSMAFATPWSKPSRAMPAPKLVGVGGLIQGALMLAPVAFTGAVQPKFCNIPQRHHFMPSTGSATTDAHSLRGHTRLFSCFLECVHQSASAPTSARAETRIVLTSASLGSGVPFLPRRGIRSA
jgi:hypothetical protein